MEVMVERAVGLDVHRDSVVACVVVGSGRALKVEKRRFSAFHSDLLRLRDWLLMWGCTHVVMESTSVYWMPVYDVLEGQFELVVCNAQHIKNVPGRKTDMTDAEWLARLLRHGLVSNSYVPPRAFRQLRELTRYRVRLIGTLTAQENRVHKLLQIAGVKLSSVASEVFGVSGRLILKRLQQGDQTPEQMANLARGRLRAKIPRLQEALTPSLNEHHRLLLGLQLDTIERLELSIAELEREIGLRLSEHTGFIDRVDTMPGADWIAGAGLLAEIGPDMSPWDSFPKLAAWAGVAPGNHQSAGKRRKVHTRQGNPYVRALLVQIAHAAVHKKGSYFTAKYNRLRRRLGEKRAIVAIAHEWLCAFYYMMKRDEPYREQCIAKLDEVDKKRISLKLVQKLTALGYGVHLVTS